MKRTNYRGTCPACFREMPLLEDNGHGRLGRDLPQPDGGTYRIARHGWAERGGRQLGVHGQAWHDGECFGVGYQPFELSPEGTIAFCKTLFARALLALNTLTRLETNPEILEGGHVRIYLDWSSRVDAPFSARYRFGDREGYDCSGLFFNSYATMHQRRVEASTTEQNALCREGSKCMDRAVSWEKKPLITAQPKVKTVHYRVMVDGQHTRMPARRAACGSRAEYSTDPTKATCKLCEKYVKASS
jgi:hypothetical protein